jgi:hypothetical protein
MTLSPTTKWAALCTSYARRRELQREDWSLAAECTNYPEEVSEVALSHVNDDKTKAAYKRTDLFEKRRALMNDWAKFCETISG